MPAPTPSTLTLTLASPIGPVHAVAITAIYPTDGATGSLTFNALGSGGKLIAPAGRGAVFVGPLSSLPTKSDVLAAVTAALAPIATN